MRSLWDDQEASQYPGDLGQRVYTSRLLGRDTTLVMHGGGNTSVKIREPNIFGDDEDILYVKGSGWNLETIQAEGFAPVRMHHLLRLATLPVLSDTDMAKELRVGMTNPAAPAPSVEAILHAVLPYKYVDHTHADAVIAVTNTPRGRDYIKDIYGNSVVILPYVMPGFVLAKQCAEHFPEEAGDQTIGMLLMNHGVFSFGGTAQIAYTRMIDLVARAEEFLAQRGAWNISLPPVEPPSAPLRHDLAALRHEVSAVAGFPVIIAAQTDEQCLSFARREDVATISQQGPATPDHVIRTKRMPLVGRDLQAFRAAYEEYFATFAPDAAQPLTMLDTAPRVILDPAFGMGAIGRTAKDAAIVNDIYRHTIDIILRATALEQYQALPARDLFEVEYWDLEQAKLRRQGNLPAFAGEIALVTGAGSGIGKACVESLLARGAAVVGLDINPDITSLFTRKDFLGLRCDVTSDEDVTQSLELAVKAFGGLDMLIVNAGIFTSSCPIANLSLDTWRNVMQVNLDANVALLREAHPLLKLAPRGGRVVMIGSRNVTAPGPGAAAYSASKAALSQLARVAALEWGGDGIRVNVIHPDAVFDTGIWTDEVLQSRAQNYNMTVEEYKRRNVLKTEVSSHDVGELAAEMCGTLFARTTGAQVPIDGGNERVI